MTDEARNVALLKKAYGRWSETLGGGDVGDGDGDVVQHAS